MTKILSVENIELYYDHIYALKGVSIDVDEGETVALIGANGAGKSSILRAITGLRPVKSGQIFYQGHAAPAPIQGRTSVRSVRVPGGDRRHLSTDCAVEGTPNTSTTCPTSRRSSMRFATRRKGDDRAGQ